jgi:hypothetical protein
LNTRSLHAEAMCWLRFGKRMPIVCTEVGPWNADILGLSDTMSIEVEIKQSRSDLLAEFRNKKAKHHQYANADQGPAAFVPNYFYFFVPEHLAEGTVKTVSELMPKAGIAVMTETNYLDGRNVRIAKKAQKLRDAPPRKGFIHTAMLRMSSELCGTILANHRIASEISHNVSKLREELPIHLMRVTGVLDAEDPEADLEARAREMKSCVEGVDIFTGDEDRAKWIAAAKKWLEAQHLNSRSWTEEGWRYMRQS